MIKTGKIQNLKKEIFLKIYLSDVKRIRVIFEF